MNHANEWKQLKWITAFHDYQVEEDKDKNFPSKLISYTGVYEFYVYIFS